MFGSRRSRFLLVLFALAAVAALVFAACGDDEDEDRATPTPGVPTPAPDISGESVDVMGIWGDVPVELQGFEAMVAPWEADTGASMGFLGQRGIGPLVVTRVEAGDPPDVAIPAEVGFFQQFAREGELTPLSACPGLEEAVRANYPQGFIDLGTVDGTLYGFFMKADGKATIWYDPKFFDENGFVPLTADDTFDDLLALSQEIEDAGFTPWSIGVESGADTGWPGTDWVQAILLNNVTGGVAANDGLLDGSVPFTDNQVKEAWEKFGQIALTEGWVSQGGGEGINATAFADAILEPFKDQPTVAMHHQAGFAASVIAEGFPNAVAGEDYTFFPWPGGAVIGSGNIVYAFNSDPATCSFLIWLASAEAQEIWAALGGFASPNKEVSLDAYPDPVTRTGAERLTQAEVFRFDLDDFFGGALQRTFWAGVLNYLADPDTLDNSLADIEAARE